MAERTVEVYLQMIVDGEARGGEADLCTDGVDEFWIPHSQIISKEHVK